MNWKKKSKGVWGMELTYRQEANYRIPDLILEQEQEAPGKYGMLRKRFLKEHRKGIYAGLLLNGTLQSHLLEIDRTARAQVEQTVQALAKAEGVNEGLKAQDPLTWIARMNNIRQRAEELAMELIYS